MIHNRTLHSNKTVDFGLGEVEDTKEFKPRCIVEGKQHLIFENVPDSVKNHARHLLRNGWKIYLVDQSRGYCYYLSKTITIPMWVTSKELGRKIWYISHEMAHAYNRKDGHGLEFMQTLQDICPPEFTHYELGYKPRNAKRAGIIEDLGL